MKESSKVFRHQTGKPASTKHNTNFIRTEVIASIRKANEIKNTPNNFNNEDGYGLNKAWLHLFHQKTFSSHLLLAVQSLKLC
jgi:hypothetical protein